MRRVSFALVLAVVLALPAVAVAGHGHHHQGNQVPCSNSAVCQYLEHIPGAGGTTSGGGDGNRQALSPQAQQALEEHGTIGSQTAGLANGTAPAGVPRPWLHGGGDNGDNGGGGTGTTSGLDVGATPAVSGGGPEVGKALSHVVSGGDSGSGMGIVFPVILGLSLVAAILLGIHRRRSPQHA